MLKRGAIKRGATRVGAIKRGAIKRGATRVGAIKRGAIKRGATGPNMYSGWPKTGVNTTVIRIA